MVIAIIAILAAMLLPALSRAKAKAEGIRCVSNMKQMQMGWMLYTDDYNGTMVPNADLGMPVPLYTTFPWVNPQGLDWHNSPANTNVLALKNSLLAPYLNSAVAVYKCPGDKIPSDNGDRVRSVSMNSYMGYETSQGPFFYTPADPTHGAPVHKFKKVNELNASFPPVQAFVFLDESTFTINDGYFEVEMVNPKIDDFPAWYHGGVGSFSFADGHAELKKWKGQETKQSYAYGVIGPSTGIAISTPGALDDLGWLRSHTTY